MEANQLHPSVAILRQLLIIYTKLQDDVETIKIADKLGILGAEDERVLYIKAVALRNVSRYHESEKTWDELYEKYNKPSYAYGYAEVLSLQDK